MSDSNRPARGRRGRGGREGRRSEAASAATPKPPYITRKIPCFEVVDEEGLQIIENNADTILEETGIEFRDMPEALDILKQGGAEIDELVAFEQLLEFLQKVCSFPKLVEDHLIDPY